MSELALGKGDLKILKDFWEDEVISTKVYYSLSKKAKGDKKTFFIRLSQMESKHALVWQEIAKKFFGATFKVSLKLKIKIFFYKLLAKLMPITFIVNYLELGERKATMEYARFLEKFREYPEVYKKIKEVIYDEIEHELKLAEMITGEKTYIETIKDAVYGMTDSLVEILALVIGLSGVSSNPLTVGLAGLISTIGGTFSMTTGAYLSVKSQNDIYYGKITELKAKKEVAVEMLEEELVDVLKENEIAESTAKQIAEELKDKPDILAKLIETLTIEETPGNPKAAAKTTGVYYILGALPAIVPFFVGYLLAVPIIPIAIIAVLIASITTFVAGVLTAVLSGVSVLKKATLNVLMIIGAALATYGIGTLARLLLGIQI